MIDPLPFLGTDMPTSAPDTAPGAGVKYRAFGARHQLGQLVRIERGLDRLGAVQTTDGDPDVQLVYANDEPRWQEAIEYRDRVNPRAKLILCVLDVPEWNLDSGYRPHDLLARLKRADAICSISLYVQSQLFRYFGIASHCIYQPIQDVSPTKRVLGERPFPQYRALLAGRLSDPNKRVELAVRGLLMAGFEPAEVAVVGGDNIGWGTNLGVVSAATLNDLYNSVDFVVCATRGAGLELPPCEGYVAGAVPVICSDLTTASELFPLHYGCFPSSHSIAYRLATLVENPFFLRTERQCMLDNANVIIDRCSPHAVASRIVGVYCSLK